MKHTVREATSDDQAFITEMLYEAFFVPPGASPFSRTIVDEPGVVGYHADFGRRAGDAGVVAVGVEGPVGAAWVRRHHGYGFVDDHTPELSIAVAEGARGHGIGTDLLTALLERVPRCSLSCDTRNSAIRLYERAGFSTVRADGEHTVIMLWSAA